MSTRWGFAYESCHLWASIGKFSPAEYWTHFHAELESPIDIMIVYRELVTNDVSEFELARRIVAATPEPERKHISRHIMSPVEVFGSQGSEHTIADQIGIALHAAKLPTPEMADQDRVGGWRYLYNLLERTVNLCGKDISKEEAEQGPLLLINSECSNLTSSIPILSRDDDNLEDVLSSNQLADICGEALRILCKSMQTAKSTAPRAERRHLLYDSMESPTGRAIAMKKFDLNEAFKSRVTRRNRWRR